MRLGRATAGLAGAAALISVVTLLARVVGFGRSLVFAHTVGADVDGGACLATAYQTANMLPNIVFEVVAGGALASAVVPLVGGQLARHDAEGLRRTTSALLTWSLAVLTPVSLACIVLAHPLMVLLLSRHPAGCRGGEVTDIATRMFLVFALQIPLYGLAVVAGGVLNAHRRFLAAAAAPLASSAVVVAAYVVFAVGFVPTSAGRFPRQWVDELSVGTTLGVLVLTATMVVPLAALRYGLRPTLRFPSGVGASARRLAAAGVATLVAQQLSVVAVIVLADGVRDQINVYSYALAVYLLPYAVLAVPIAIAAFSTLSAHAGVGDDAAFVATAARSTRAVVLAAFLGAALLAGTARPVASVFHAGSWHVWQLTWALVAFAPGLLGYALVAHLGRVLYARDRGRAAATATVSGWLVVIAASVVLTLSVPDRWVVTALGSANSLGMLVAGSWLLLLLLREAGPASLAGMPRAAAAGLTGALAGGGLAAAAVDAASADTKALDMLLAAGAALLALAGFGAVVLLVDGRDLRALVPRRSSGG